VNKAATLTAVAASRVQCDDGAVLDLLAPLAAALVTLGGDLRETAVDRLVGAVLETNQEVLARLDGIEAKLDALKAKDMEAGLQYLRQALEPHRTLPEKADQVRRALDAFTGAAAVASDDPLGRSIARVYQAACWKCLGKEEDVRLRLGEAAADAHDAVYQAAIRYNEPQRTAAASGQSWVRRHRPGWEWTGRPSLMATLDYDPSEVRIGSEEDPEPRVAALVIRGIGKASPRLERWLTSEVTRPSHRLQVGMKPVLDQVNEWSREVTELRDRVQRPDRPGERQHVRFTVHLHDNKPTGPGRAVILAMLSPGTAIEVRGIAISFAEAIPHQKTDIFGREQYVDVLLKADLSRYGSKELPAYRNKPWFCRHRYPGGLRIAPRLGYSSGWSPGEGTPPGPELRSGYVGPGHQDEISGWTRCHYSRNHHAYGHPYYYAMSLYPVQKAPRRPGPRPYIIVGVWLADQFLQPRRVARTGLQLSGGGRLIRW
jgi:hypothetical protein